MESVERPGTASRAKVAPVRGGALSAFFLGRLERLVELSREQGPALAESELHLIRHCTYSTYLDCVALGAQAEAQRILARQRG